jgi:hypothetical protein
VLNCRYLTSLAYSATWRFKILGSLSFSCTATRLTQHGATWTLTPIRYSPVPKNALYWAHVAIVAAPRNHDVRIIDQAAIRWIEIDPRRANESPDSVHSKFDVALMCESQSPKFVPRNSGFDL